MFPVPEPIAFKKLTSVDQWILSEANELVERILPDCNLLDFHKPAIEIRGFTWNFFADHIIEMLKGRCFNSEGTFTEDEQKSGWFTLHEVLKIITLALAPISPFVTDQIYRELYDAQGSHVQNYPSIKKEWKSEIAQFTELVLQTNAGFWKFKRENGLSLRQGIPEAYISENMKPWMKDLQAMHAIDKISFGKPKSNEFVEITLPEMESESIYILPPKNE